MFESDARLFRGVKCKAVMLMGDNVKSLLMTFLEKGIFAIRIGSRGLWTSVLLNIVEIVLRRAITQRNFIPLSQDLSGGKKMSAFGLTGFY